MITSETDKEESTSKENILLEVDANPFKNLKISENWKQLDNITDRTICGACKKSRKYFCYTCYVPVLEIQDIVPNIKLPIKIDIIKHAKEIDGKSTAVHAAVLAPQDVQIFTYPCIPDYDPNENVVLIFPNKDATSVEEACDQFYKRICEPVCKRQCLENRRFVVHRAVFIDSTWNQSRGIFKDPRIKALPSVVLKTRLSQFWRHQTDSPRWYLATIEAIHQFLVELEASQWRLDHKTVIHNGVSDDKCSSKRTNDGSNSLDNGVSDDKCSSESTNNGSDSLDNNGVSDDKCSSESTNNGSDSLEYSYNGHYDNLLFFFRFMYSKIHTLYNHEQLKSYKRRLE